MAVQSGLGENKAREMTENVNGQEARCESLLAQRDYAEMFDVQRDRVREAVESAAKMYEVYILFILLWLK